jgi:dethiobiotin synthetase
VSSLFITGSGTGVGKTLLASLIIRQLRSRGEIVRALKPVVTGFDPADPAGSDPKKLLDALELPADEAHLDKISPWRFRAPLSPDMAAAREHRSIPFKELVEFCAASTTGGMTIIEGVGGIMVPLDREHTVLDWIAALDCPAVLVTGSYLGSISHTLTALASLQEKRLTILSIVVSESADQPVPASETARTIERFSGGTPVRVLPRLTEASYVPNLLQLVGLET